MYESRVKKNLGKAPYSNTTNAAKRSPPFLAEHRHTRTPKLSFQRFERGHFLLEGLYPLLHSSDGADGLAAERFDPRVYCSRRNVDVLVHAVVAKSERDDTAREEALEVLAELRRRGRGGLGRGCKKTCRYAASAPSPSERAAAGAGDKKRIIWRDSPSPLPSRER